MVAGLQALPEQLTRTLALEEHASALAQRYCGSANALFISRNIGYPLALEGAQKLKELSYIHAEAYPAQELKHGPLALVSPTTPTFIAMPNDALIDKALASIAEVRARSGPVIAIGPDPSGRITAACDTILVTSNAIVCLSCGTRA